MLRLRTNIAKRLIVGLLVFCWLSAVGVPVAQATLQSDSSSYANWLRLQLRTPADPAFERSLAAAEATGPESLHAFLKAFIDAYESEETGVLLAEVFDTSTPSDEALIQFLQFRYRTVIGNAVLPRSLYLSVSTQTTPQLTPHQMGKAQKARSADKQHHERGLVSEEARTQVVIPLRSYSAAFPLGP